MEEMTIFEAAAALGRSDRQVRRMVTAKKLISAGPGRVTRESVEALVGSALVAYNKTEGMIYVEREYHEGLIRREHEAIMALKGIESRLLEDHSQREADAARIAELEEEVNRLKNRSLWQRLFNK